MKRLAYFSLLLMGFLGIYAIRNFTGIGPVPVRSAFAGRLPSIEFDNKFANSIQKVSKHLTDYVSSNDRALLMSHWLNRGRRLGRLAEVSTLFDDLYQRLLSPDEIISRRLHLVHQHYWILWND